MSKTPNNICKLVGVLDEQVLKAQASINIEGRRVVGEWLKTAHEEGIFEEIVDWLLGNDADRYFNDNRESLAVQMVRNAIQEFEIRDENLEDPYKAARIWFEVN